MERIAFPDMPYERPDAQATKQAMASLTQRLREAAGYDSARAVFLEKDELDKRLDTLYHLAYIRHSIDTRDTFY